MAFGNGPRIVTNGLVLCLDASDRNSYPGSGTTWTNMVGSNNGTLTNSPVFDAGNGGNIVLDGSNDYISIPFETILYDCSIEIWFKATGLSSYQYLLSIGDPSTNSYSFYMDMNDPDGSSFAQTMWTYWNSGGSPNSVIPKTGTYGDWNDSTWRHYVFTRSTTISPYTLHYMNGILVSSINRTGDQTTQFGNGSGYYLKLGSYRTNALYWQGNQASIKIYNRVLSATEIKQNYNATKSRFNLT